MKEINNTIRSQISSLKIALTNTIPLPRLQDSQPNFAVALSFQKITESCLKHGR